MSDTQNPIKKRIYTFVKVAVAIISVPVILIAFIWYENWSAEREAQVFCEEIEFGSDIFLLIKNFEKHIGFEKKEGGKVSARHYGFPQEGFSKDSHTFIFPGFMFDKAYCDVSVGENGKVISKLSYMQYD